MVRAVGERNVQGYVETLPLLAEAASGAGPDEINAGLARLAPAVTSIPLGLGIDLAGLTAAMVDVGADVPTALSLLAPRAAEAMEKATRFATRYGGDPDDLPDPGNPELYEEAVGRLTAPGPAQLPEAQAHELGEAWFAGEDWVGSVLGLAFRKDARVAMPERERLIAASAAADDYFSAAHWLYGLLLVRDNATLTVLHRETGRGYKVTMSGVGDNFQLHTLLAATLIGDEGRGLLPGTPPTPEEFSAAFDNPEGRLPGGTHGHFNLVDGYGNWIWGEGRPADIPLYRDELVIVLDPPAVQRTWNPGRIYPQMQPEFTLQRQLSQAEAADWLASVKPGKSASESD